MSDSTAGWPPRCGPRGRAADHPPGASDANRYIQRVHLDNTGITRNWVRRNEVARRRPHPRNALAID